MSDPLAAFPSTASIWSRLRALAPSLPPSDRRAAEVIADLGDAVLERSVTEVALAANVAESTVVRACKRLGFGGYQGLKLAVAKESRPALDLVADEIDPDDTTAEMVTKVFASSVNVLTEAATAIDVTAVEAVIEAVTTADRVLFVGFGPSSPMAQDAAYRFRSIGITVEAPVDGLTQHLAGSLLGSSDVCIVISHTGATNEAMAVAQEAHLAGATTAAITSFARSPLTEVVDHVVVAGGRQLGFRVEAMASRMAHLCVLDAIYVGVARRNEPRALKALEKHHEVAAKHQY